MTLLELIVATIVLGILAGMAVPLARIIIYREKERELRAALWEMRDAIDKYEQDASIGKFMVEVDSFGYPPDLETLVNGVDENGHKIKYLRHIPKDPMTGKPWGLRSNQDDPESESWGGQNVFDVYTTSEGTALDGTKYKDW